MFLKKVPKPYTYTDYFKSHKHELTSLPCFSVLKMYIQRLNYQIFPMKISEAFRYVQNVQKINGKEIQYLWVKEN